MSDVFAKGKRAKAICDRSGFEYPYRQMVREPGTGLFVHISESDGKWNIVDHPQNHPPEDLSDAIALRWARPTRDEVPETRMFLACGGDGQVILFGGGMNGEFPLMVPTSVYNN